MNIEYALSPLSALTFPMFKMKRFAVFTLFRQIQQGVKRYSFPAFIAFWAFSCSTPDAGFIAEVEKLEKTIALSEQSLQALDTSKIGAYFRKSNEHLQFIQENTKDTIDKQTAILLSDYSASRKSLRMFLENYSDALKELQYSKNQLFALKTDVENNLMAEDKFADYYSSESKSVEKLNELIQNTVQWYASAVKMYEVKSPLVEKIVSEMKEKQKNLQ